MAIVQKLNRQLTVSDTEIDKYLSDGYDQIDEKGAVIKKATGKKTISIEVYNKEVNKLKAEIAELKKEETKKTV